VVVFNPTPQARSGVVRLAWPGQDPNARPQAPTVVPTVYRVQQKRADWQANSENNNNNDDDDDDDDERTPLVAQMELNDDLESQLTVSHVPPSLYASAL
jgi:hypothetical protein